MNTTDFLRRKYKKELMKAAESKEKSIIIDFNDIHKYDPLSASALLNSPEEILGMMKESAEEIAGEKIEILLRNLPKEQNIKINDIKDVSIGKLYTVEVFVTEISDEIHQQTYEIVFECNGCGRQETLKQQKIVISRPSNCECGETFKEIENKTRNIKTGEIKDPSSKKQIKMELVGTLAKTKLSAGDKINAVGTFYTGKKNYVFIPMFIELCQKKTKGQSSQ